MDYIWSPGAEPSGRESEGKTLNINTRLWTFLTESRQIDFHPQWWLFNSHDPTLLHDVIKLRILFFIVSIRISLYPLWTMNICRKFHGDLSHRCWDISVWTNMVERLSQPTSPCTKAVHLFNPSFTWSNIDWVIVKLTVDWGPTDTGSLSVKVDTNISEY